MGEKTARDVIAGLLDRDGEELGSYADFIVEKLDAAGFVIVPKEPTLVMIHAGGSCPGMMEINALIGMEHLRIGGDVLHWPKRGEQPPIVQAYKAMIAVASIPTGEKG